MNALVEQLVERRRALGISQREVTRRIGSSTATLHSWESGRSLPTLGLLERWAAALDLRLDLCPCPEYGNLEHVTPTEHVVVESSRISS